ncbi:MAG: hypothetical protein ABRQ39_32830 [Candidatus Eremiobacterota bacterium]
MKKILFTSFLLIFILLLTHTPHAGTVYPLCDYIVWGQIYNYQGIPCPNVEVILDRAQLGKPVLSCYTNKEGFYTFYSYGQFEGNITIVVNREVQTNFIKIGQKGIAYGLDYSYVKNKGFGEIYKSPIVYITETGDCYHKYGCQCLKESCKPIPKLYCRLKSMPACSICKP